MPSIKNVVVDGASDNDGRDDEDLLEAGKVYDLEVFWTREAESSNGNDMIKLGMRADCGGAPVWDRLVFSPKALFRIIEFMKSAGMAVPGPGEDITIDADSCKGKRVKALVGVKEFKGKDQNKVIRYIVDKDEPVSPVTDNGDAF